MATQLNVLQNSIFPDPDLSDSPELYFRFSGSSARGVFTEKSVQITPQDIVSTDTFFNSLSISPSLHGTGIEDVSIELHFDGNCEVSLCHLKPSDEEVLIQKAMIQGSTWTSDPVQLRKLKEGLLFVR